MNPAVGVDPRAVPSAFIVQCLTILAFIAPKAQVSLTPFEDATGYACPPDSTRNFNGHWPLSTSKMCLDVTSKRVKNDIQDGNILLDTVDRVLVISGEEDEVVPFSAIKEFYDHIKPASERIIVNSRIWTRHDVP